MSFRPVNGHVKFVTTRAVLLIIDEEEHWIPKSVIEEPDVLSVGDDDIRIASWFCDKEGIA